MRVLFLLTLGATSLGGAVSLSALFYRAKKARESRANLARESAPPRRAAPAPVLATPSPVAPRNQNDAPKIERFVFSAFDD